MKKVLSVLLIMITMLLFSSCSGNVQETLTIAPESSKMRAIFQLATMECYYHNVAKYSEKDASGALWWKKDKRFWVEYEGIVTLGVDASEIAIDINEDTVTITLPPAKVFGAKIDEKSLTEESFFVDKKSADIKWLDQSEAIKDAQAKMVEVASKDTTLLLSAQQRSQVLLEQYIENIEELTGKKYVLEWIYVDTSGEKINSPTETTMAS